MRKLTPEELEIVRRAAERMKKEGIPFADNLKAYYYEEKEKEGGAAYEAQL